MATQKVSEMTAAVTAADADLVPIVQGGVNKKATVDLILDGLTGARVTTALGYTAANNASLANYLALAGGTMTGALVLAGAPTIDLHAATKLYVDGLIAGKQPLDATLTALAALGAGPGFLQVTGADTFSIAALTDAQINAALGYTAANAAALNASNLTTGTIPDARFPAVLPAISGANLTNLPGGGLPLSGQDIGLARSAAGVLKVTDGSTGSGDLLAGGATFHDDTAVTGSTTVTVTGGAGQGTDPLLALSTPAGINYAYMTLGTTTRTWQITTELSGGDFYVFDQSGVAHRFRIDATTGTVSTSGQFGFKTDGSAETVGISNPSSGILKVTDGSSGFGRLQANGYGLDGNTVGMYSNGSSGLIFYTGASLDRWTIPSSGHFAPTTDNAYDIGTSSNRVKDIYLSGAFKATTANGAVAAIKTISESITLDTGATFTDSTADLLPAGAEIISVSARITTGIATATDWALGDAATPTRFASANATLTAGTTTVGKNHRQGSVATDAAGPIQGAAAKLRITTTGTPSAGVVRVTVAYWEHTAPTS